MEYRDSLDIDGTCVTIRAMQPSDRDIEQRFVRELSPRSRYYRFHAGLNELTPAMLERFTHVRYPDEMALIATIQDGEGERQVGVARYARYPGTDRAEIAVVVADDWQEKGIGSRLLLALRRIAHDAGIRYLEASVLLENKRMLALAQRLGFSIKPIKPGNGTNLDLGKDLDEK